MASVICGSTVFDSLNTFFLWFVSPLEAGFLGIKGRLNWVVVAPFYELLSGADNSDVVLYIILWQISYKWTLEISEMHNLFLFLFIDSHKSDHKISFSFIKGYISLDDTRLSSNYLDFFWWAQRPNKPSNTPNAKRDSFTSDKHSTLSVLRLSASKIVWSVAFVSVRSIMSTRSSPSRWSSTTLRNI